MKRSLLGLALFLLACEPVAGPRREGPVALVGVTPGVVSAGVGTTVTLTAVLLDAANRQLRERAVAWSSSDSTRAIVSSAGVVEAIAEGPVMITATSEGISGSASLIVDTRVPASLTIEPDSIDLLPRNAVHLKAVVRDAAGAEIEHRQVLWMSSAPNILRVYPDGYASAVGHDQLVTVTAALGNLAAQARVNVLPDPCIAAAPFAMGQTVSTELTTGECLRSGGEYAARYRLDVSAQTPVRITMTSAAFNPYLILTDLAGNVIEVDDDTGPGSAARISGPLPAGGYIVWATSAHPGDTGPYTLSLVPETDDRCDPVHSLQMGTTVTGYLSVLDCRYQSGQFNDFWYFELTTPQTIRAVMRSSAVNSFLTLTNAAGDSIFLWDDDSGGGRDAQIAITLPAGEYLLWASSLNANERGRYTLSLEPELVSACRSVQPIAPNVDVAGQLATSDCRLQSGQYADRYRLDLGSARAVRIDLLSAAFDTYLLVSNLSGQTVIAQDGGGTNARLDLNLQAGSYIVWATSALPDRTGSYLLQVQ